MWISAPSDIISKVLSPALKLWLRSQVEQIDDLELHIQGRDRQIVRGYVPCVRLQSRGAVYQGLHLGMVQLRGENIRLNIGQMLKGKPLRFLEPLHVIGEVYIREADLNASLDSFILSNALTDLLKMLLSGEFPSAEVLQSIQQIIWQKVTLLDGHFALIGMVTDIEQKKTVINISAGLGLVNPQTLCIYPKQVEGLAKWSDLKLHDFTVDLGKDVELESLRLEPGNISFHGRLSIET